MSEGSRGWCRGSVVSQFVNAMGRLQPRRASSVATWSMPAASQLSMGVARAVARMKRPRNGAMPGCRRSVPSVASGSHSIPSDHPSSQRETSVR